MGVQTKLTELDGQIKDLERQSVELAEQGEIDAAHNASTRADKLKVALGLHRVHTEGC